MNIPLPNWDTKTWAIVGLSVALLALILLVEPLRENFASWIVWLGVLLGGSVREIGREPKQNEAGEEGPTEPPSKEDYEKDPVNPEDHHVEPNQHRPDQGELDEEYWGLDGDNVE